MKFEKREITLNERDSLLDVLFAYERLACEYLDGARLVERKEVREPLKKRLVEILDDVYLLEDTIRRLKD